MVGGAGAHPVRPHVVVIGGGFGGLETAKRLARVPVQVTLIDRRNYHLFQPLLYQVATAGLSPADIAHPIRSILRKQRYAHVLMESVIGIDASARQVITEKRRVSYDYLVVATGARHSYFGHDDWEAFAPGLKTIDDATDIRRRILTALEVAEAEEGETARRPWLTFVIVGAGPTGVELAGALAELTKRALARDFRSIDPTQTRIVLAEAGPRILSAYPESLSRFAVRALERLGVEVHTQAPVVSCDGTGVALGRKAIAARTVVWAAGVQASPAAHWLGLPADKAGRVAVEADLSVPAFSNVFVIGDTALCDGPDGKPLPGVAPVAKQQGQYVARAIRSRLAGEGIPPFRYRNWGSLATIGRGAAIADFGFVRLRGRVAWILWCVVHIAYLVGFQNRLSVLLQWTWSYFTFKRGARLITGRG